MQAAGHSDSVEAVAFARTLALTISAGMDGKLCIWDNASFDVRGTCEHPEVRSPFGMMAVFRSTDLQKQQRRSILKQCVFRCACCALCFDMSDDKPSLRCAGHHRHCPASGPQPALCLLGMPRRRVAAVGP